MQPGTEDVAAFIAGFVAAEGHFSHSADRFAFVVALGAIDTPSCHALRAFFGVGAVRTYPRREERYDDEVVFRVRALRDLVEVIVPFMEVHLPPSHKRHQFEGWRDALLEYWEHSAKRHRPCSIDGCDRPNRSRGLCRQHYYTTFRR